MPVSRFFVLAALAIALALSAVAQAPHSVVVSWAYTPDAGTDPVTVWVVQRTATSGSGYVTVFTGDTTSASFTDTNVSAGQVLYYTVTGSNPSGGGTVQSLEGSCTVPFSPAKGSVKVSLAVK